MPRPHLVIFGPRASGKTTVGRLIADRLGLPFVDLDGATLAVFPEPTIKAVWAKRGEIAWREAEATMLDDILRRDDTIVLALGGGTPVIPDAQRSLMAAGVAGRSRTVYLQCPVEILQERLEAETGDRPPLVGDDAVSEVASVIASREPTYLAVADHVVDASGDVESVATAIISLFGA